MLGHSRSLEQLLVMAHLLASLTVSHSHQSLHPIQLQGLCILGEDVPNLYSLQDGLLTPPWAGTSMVAGDGGLSWSPILF